MGNSTSNPIHNNSNRRTPQPPQPPPRSRPLKTKKRSIVDHPALLQPVPSPATPRQHPAAASSPIAIPTQPGQPPQPRPTPPPNNDSFAVDYVPDLLSHTQRDENSTHRPIQYNSTRSFGGVRRGGPQGGGWSHDASPHTLRPPPAFMPEVVRCSIPLRIPQAEGSANPRRRKPRTKQPSLGEEPEDEDDDHDDPEDENGGLIPTTILWHGGGKEVLLAGTFHPLEWRARERMRFDPTTSTHSLTLYLPPGAYRVKFIVDDAWRCAESMPTAADDETGNLVNYVTVEDSSALDIGPTPGTEERQGRDARVMKANRRRTYHTHLANSKSPKSSVSRSPYHPPLLPPSESSFWGDLDTDTELEVTGWQRGRDGILEKWTNIIPEPLIAAAQQEEAYLVAIQAQREARRGGAGTKGSLGALGMGVPSIPPAPRLPRHLDKVILNTHAGKSAGSASGSHSGRSGRSGKHKSRSGLGMTGLLTPDAALTGGVAGAGLEKSRSTAAMEQWAPADDGSILPVPSHVVLHHLGTSAIKNGVLAVSDTTRYNKKYVTTIYYKPT